MVERLFAEARRLFVSSIQKGIQSSIRSREVRDLEHITIHLKFIHDLNENFLEAKANWLC